MNNFNKLALGLCGALVFVSPAQAQEAEASKSGFWANALLGAEKTNRGHTKEKFLFGLGGGYDAALGKARLGLEAEAAKTGASGCASQVDDDGDAFCYKNSYDLYAGVRAGFEVAPKLTVYAKGGYVGGQFKGSNEDGDIVGSEKTWLNGWRAGGGLERDFGGAFVKVEYAYLDVPPDSPLRVGDLISFGISHPCTTFDRWPALYVVNDELDVIGAVRTYF